MLILINSVLLCFSISGILLVIIFYPLSIWIVYLIKRQTTPDKHSDLIPTVSIVSVVYNAEDLIVDKIKNLLSLNYPSEKYEIIIFSDGSTDETENKVKDFSNRNVLFLSSVEHEGKISAINKAICNCSGEIIIFSDADAILNSNSVLNIVKHFALPEIGGVCGRRIIYESNKELKDAQSFYIGFDSKIKILESQTGNISSNDGKLYAVRRELFKPIPPPVTDDFYACLSIIKQNYRFIFEPDAKAFIKVPSRNSSHEIQRRRRIVTRSLRCIYLMKELLNPFRYGIFSIRLAINKIVRRLLPLFLLLVFVNSLCLSSYSPSVKVILFLQLVFYALAFSYLISVHKIFRVRLFTKVTSYAYYFCLGNLGSLLGLLDFLMGKQITKWTPLKTDY